MQDPKPSLRSQAATDPMAALPARVRFWTWTAWLLMVLEQTVRSLGPALAVIGVFAILSLFDVFSALPLWLHWSLLALFAAALIAGLWWGFRTWRPPLRSDALHRLEADSGLVHRPLTHLTDRQASNLVDPWATVLWAHHQKRLLAGLGELTLARRPSNVARRDPLALRGLAVLLLALGIAIAWDQSGTRLFAAVTPQARSTADLSTITVEAWITPPDYTRLAPIALKADPAAESTEEPVEAADATPIETPVGSKLLVQIQGLDGAASLNANNATKPLEMLDSETQRAELVLKEGDKIGISGGGLDVGWPIALRPDLPPTAALQQPRATERAVLQVAYGGKDDFGVTDMRLVITQGEDSFELPLTAHGADPRQVKGASYQDLTAHPWAGLPVELRAVARDALDQIGASAPVAMTLPERKFYHPVARAIIEQRKRLAKDGGASALPVARKLIQLMIQPEAFDNSITTFMALDFAVKRMTSNAMDKEELGSVMQLMWDTALALEDGGVSMAMRELRRLQRELEEALARGASDEEIERLMNELQQAMNEYLRQMQEQLAQAMQKGMELGRLDPNALQLSQQDLNQMLNEARRMAQNGARESAQQMLQQLQNMLENLQMAMPMPGQGNGQAQRMMNDLGKIMQEQQQLLQDTFRRQRGQQPGQGQGQQEQGMGEGTGQGMPGGNGADAQEALRQQLGELMRRFGNATGDIPQGLGQAEQFMRGATDALRGEQLDSAAQAQNDALEQLKQGMQQMSEAMRQQMGAQRGPGQRDPMDPFGRALSDDEGPGGDAFAREGSDVVPLDEQLDRSRQIFEELRQRRNQPFRPKIERDYLDRLLRQF
ncbi:TIGR02302 family protein [Dongia deserti]|uniref:TIGR02302 family protein n=1 Tax=Dongia deserti TaxID=2268030 RepID=UPI000E654F9E|nr:TIGR02302 family protein [Dongia deserti]